MVKTRKNEKQEKNQKSKFHIKWILYEKIKVILIYKGDGIHLQLLRE